MTINWELMKRKLRLPALTRGQLAIARATGVELSSGNEDPQPEDIQNTLNRHERRVVASEARARKRLLTKRTAEKKRRADKRFAKGLVSL